MMHVGIVYDYDEVQPIAVFGPFDNVDQALAAGQAYIHRKVIEGDWSPDVLDPDYEEIQVITEPLYPSPESKLAEENDRK